MIGGWLGIICAVALADGVGLVLLHRRARSWPLGVDIEALPFVVVAALLSLGLTAAAWVRPRSTRC